MTECGCGCGEQTRGGRFRPGHDARLHARQRRDGLEVVRLDGTTAARQGVAEAKSRMAARLVSKLTPERAARVDRLRAIVEDAHPLTVRRAFYIGVGEGLYTKDEKGYDRAIDDSLVLRDKAIVGYDAIIDPGTSVRGPEMWSSPAEAAQALARDFRLDPWSLLPSRLAVTCETDGLAVALAPHLDDLPIAVWALGGNASASALAELAEWLADAETAAVVLHVGDADGQGYDIERDVRDRLALHAERLGSVVPTVERVWLTVEQAQELGLTSRPPKRNDRGELTAQDKAWGFTECWEAEAGDPADIADIIRWRASTWLPDAVLDDVRSRDEAARTVFRRFADSL